MYRSVKRSARQLHLGSNGEIGNTQSGSLQPDNVQSVSIPDEAVECCLCVEPVVNDHCFSSLSKRQQEELSRVHQTQTQEVLAGFDMAIGKQYDLIEVCAPWDSPLVEEVEKQGGEE
jgi:hypothetical protein